MKHLSTDVLIIGAGAAGLVAALNLSDHNVLVVAKAPVGAGASSAWAQGGIAAAVGRDDHTDLHKRDTIDVGGGLCDEQVVKSVTGNGPKLIDALVRWGVQFDRDTDGGIKLGREAAHSVRRILHANGDASGKEIMRGLGQAVLAADHIDLLDDCRCYELILHKGRVQGAFGKTSDGETVVIGARAVILATGGIGNLFGYTTNPEEACGDGLAMAARAGARLSDLEFVQFHPTAIDVGLKPMPLATEALRGEGAKLIDQNGVRFMPSIHKDAELAPRDVVARAIFNRTKAGKKVYLDATGCVGDRFPTAFPTVWAYCQDAGVDPRVEPIPVTPAAHYHMGGVWVDEGSKTSLDGLWAVGEVACTGLHGANRLASNSLLEAVVTGYQVAENLTLAHYLLDVSSVSKPREGAFDETVDLSDLLYKSCGVERNEATMLSALTRIAEWEDQKDRFSQNFYNQLLVAKMILVCALERRESRGGHFRTDYTETEKRYQKRTFTTLNEIEAFVRGLNLVQTQKGTEEPCLKPA
jgi:L-aspartate oxidase